MDDELRISPGKLQEVLRVLLEQVAPREGEAIAVEGDFFWDVPSPAAYDPYAEPTCLTVGQLSESWGSLEKILAGDKLPLGYGLVWLGDVLRAIGHESTG